MLNLIDGLPRNSAYIEAITQDEEWAKLVINEPPAKQSVRMRDYSPEVERLTDLVDLIKELIVATVAVAGGKPKPPKPAPRPTTAIERVRRHERERKHRSLVARLLPRNTAGAAPTSPPAAPPTPEPAPAGPGTLWLRQQGTRRRAT